MPLLALLLALQADQDPPESDSPRKRQQFAFGPIAQYWFPRFKGEMRVDGSSPGTTLNFVDDLNLPDEAAIPMIGGGSIGVQLNETRNDRLHFAGVAEYWTHSWRGREVLAADTRLGDQLFFGGSAVSSRFTLSSVTLDLQAAAIGKEITFGGTLSIQIRTARLRMDGVLADASEDIDDVYWGGGMFFEWKPVPFLLAGLSMKGFTSFGDAGETGAGDFKFYGGGEWGPFRLEGGYRVIVYDHERVSQSLSYTLYGAYALASIIVRF